MTKTSNRPSVHQMFREYETIEKKYKNKNNLFNRTYEKSIKEQIELWEQEKSEYGKEYLLIDDFLKKQKSRLKKAYLRIEAKISSLEKSLIHSRLGKQQKPSARQRNPSASPRSGSQTIISLY